MRKSRFSEEQIIGILKRIEAGQLIADVCHEVGIRQSSDGIYYRWKAQYGAYDPYLIAARIPTTSTAWQNQRC